MQVQFRFLKRRQKSGEKSGERMRGSVREEGERKKF